MEKLFPVEATFLSNWNQFLFATMKVSFLKWEITGKNVWKLETKMVSTGQKLRFH